MQLPKRKSQQLKGRDDDEASNILTAEGLQRLKETLVDLEKRQQPQAIEDVSVAVQKGDLSENAEYQEARARLSRIQARIFSIKDRLKRVQVIAQDPASAGRIQLGATVVVEVNGNQRTYEIVGPRETNPSQGRISHVSPIGEALLGHHAGEEVLIQTQNGTVTYRILEVR
ncbi:MAG: transcription elongation factor GreA [Patescibacteria group bacterium]